MTLGETERIRRKKIFSLYIFFFFLLPVRSIQSQVNGLTCTFVGPLERTLLMGKKKKKKKRKYEKEEKKKKTTLNLSTKFTSNVSIKVKKKDKNKHTQKVTLLLLLEPLQM